VLVPGPTGRFRPLIPAVEEWAYKPDDGTGKKVGVAGREDGVGIELVVAVVLPLVVESRDCGLRIAAFMVLLNREAPLSFCTVGDAADVEAARRNAVGAEGLEARLRSFSVSLTGDGESSIMSTQPDVSAPGVFFGLTSMSARFLARLDLKERSSPPFDRNEVERSIFAGVLASGPSVFELKVDAARALAFE